MIKKKRNESFTMEELEEGIEIQLTFFRVIEYAMLILLMRIDDFFNYS